MTNPHNSWLYTKILALEFPSEVTEMRLSRSLLNKKFEKVDETYQDILKVSVQRQRIEKMDVMESYRIANKKPDHKESAFEKMERDSRLRHFERMNKTQVSKTRALALDLDKDDVLRTLGALPQAASSSSGNEAAQSSPPPARAESAAAPVHHSAVGVMAAPGTTGSSSSYSSPPGTSTFRWLQAGR